MAKSQGVENLRKGGRPFKVEQHLMDKRDELVWALSLQDYNRADIGKIFNVHRSVISRIMKKKPRDWKPKWIKASYE